MMKLVRISMTFVNSEYFLVKFGMLENKILQDLNHKAFIES